MTEGKPIQPISSLFGHIVLEKKKGVNSPRSEQVKALCEMMDGDTKRFKYWLGRTKKLSPDTIYQIMKTAKTGRNQKAFFQWLLKQELE